MKKRTLVLLAICAFVTNFEVTGLSQPIDQRKANYVVIGAFAIEGHAHVWIENAKKLNYTAISEINLNRNLWYVYVTKTGDRSAAFAEATKIRKATPYWDTWVFYGVLGAKGSASDKGSDIDPINNKPVQVEGKDGSVTKNGLPAGSQKLSENSGTVATINGANTTNTNEGVTAGGTESAANLTPPSGNASTSALDSSLLTTSTAIDEKATVADAEEGSRNFVFKIFTAEEQRVLAGEVDILDADRSRKIASYQGNQNVVLKPVNKTGNLSLICEVFGYRRMKLDMNFNKPLETAGIVQEGNQTVVPFGLVRLQKGDISVMYNVYFFKDAAIMRPESRSEVNSLLAMMQENPKYRIRIHGHTNGNAAGKVISMGESKKFFALTDTKEGFGSAKKLSEERAKVIRDYLTTEGIDAKRMEIKAWGGKRPVEDKMSEKAQSNVRVEVEILEDK